jgi:hypothetical protein
MDLVSLFVERFKIRNYHLNIEDDGNSSATFYYDDYSITLDLDIQWCRIHRWYGANLVLLSAIELESNWDDPQQCFNIILNKFGEYVE